MAFSGIVGIFCGIPVFGNVNSLAFVCSKCLYFIFCVNQLVLWCRFVRIGVRFAVVIVIRACRCEQSYIRPTLVRCIYVAIFLLNGFMVFLILSTE